MKKGFLFLIICSISLNLFSQSLEWVNTIGGNERDVSNAILILKDQSTIQIGTFMDTVSVSTTDGLHEYESMGWKSVFIQKINPDGSLVWFKQLGGSSAYSNAACLDKDENILITGYFSGSVDFDPGIGVFELNTIVGNSDYYILKLDVNGDFIWAKSFGGNSFDYGYDIATDSAGNVYTTGFFEESVDFSGTGDFQTSNGADDIFIHKLDVNGNYMWAKTLGGSSIDIGYGLDVDESGNIFVAGIFGESVDFNPSEGIEEIMAAGELDAFVLKLTSIGDFEWVRTIGGIWYDYSYDVKCTSENDLIVTGSFFHLPILIHSMVDKYLMG